MVCGGEANWIASLYWGEELESSALVRAEAPCRNSKMPLTKLAFAWSPTQSRYTKLTKHFIQKINEGCTGEESLG